MQLELYTDKVQIYLDKLCVKLSSRRVGSQGNRAATDFFAETVASFGFQTACPEFECIDWSQDGVDLTIGDQPFEAFVGPYSLGGRVNAPLAVVSTVDELAAAELTDKILLMRGDIAKEQLMPKNFPFYNPDRHKHIIHLLETKQPKAIIAATTQDTGLAGAVSPFPLIEDGDFDIPSAYMTEEMGNRLAEYAGQELRLNSRATRFPATGCNVIANKGANPKRRVVLFAHIDAKDGTPGAIDNATGVIILLLLAELLADYSGNLSVEIVALNGEDYYDASGEKQYVALNEGRFDEIVLGINSDGVGYYEGNTAYSLYDCPADIAGLIHKAFSAHQNMIEGELWYQSDHGLFLMHQIPALALTSDHFTELWTEIAHTPKDVPEIVDGERLVNVAIALRELLLDLNRFL